MVFELYLKIKKKLHEKTTRRAGYLVTSSSVFSQSHNFYTWQAIGENLRVSQV